MTPILWQQYVVAAKQHLPEGLHAIITLFTTPQAVLLGANLLGSPIIKQISTVLENLGQDFIHISDVIKDRIHAISAKTREIQKAMAGFEGKLARLDEAELAQHLILSAAVTQLWQYIDSEQSDLAALFTDEWYSHSNTFSLFSPRTESTRVLASDFRKQL